MIISAAVRQHAMGRFRVVCRHSEARNGIHNFGLRAPVHRPGETQRLLSTVIATRPCLTACKLKPVLSCRFTNAGCNPALPARVCELSVARTATRQWTVPVMQLEQVTCSLVLKSSAGCCPMLGHQRDIVCKPSSVDLRALHGSHWDAEFSVANPSPPTSTETAVSHGQCSSRLLLCTESA